MCQGSDVECVTDNQSRSCSYPEVFGYEDVESMKIQFSV